MGIDDLRLFDLDGVEDEDIIEQILKKLGLPENYAWVVQSGSGNGYHIYLPQTPSPILKMEIRKLFERGYGGEKSCL